MNKQTKEMIEKILKVNNATFINGVTTFDELEKDYGVFETGDMIIEMFENDVCYYRQISDLNKIESTIQEFKKIGNENPVYLLSGDTPWDVYETVIL